MTPAAPDPGRWRHFADTRRVAAVEGDAVHRWHAAAKHPEPVLRPDRPWDRAGAFVYGTVLREGDRLRLWYQARAALGAGNSHAVAYAESGDGLRWEKPDLGVVAFDGSRANNLTDAALHLASVLPPDPGDSGAADDPDAGATASPSPGTRSTPRCAGAPPGWRPSPGRGDRRPLRAQRGGPLRLPGDRRLAPPRPIPPFRRRR